MSAGFTSFREPIEADKVRGKPQKFAEHYTQAELFWNSQSPVERAHIVRAFRFELTRVQTPAIRKRVVAQLANVSAELAEAVATGLGIEIPPPLPKAAPKIELPEVSASPALSLLARPGEAGVRSRRIAILVADGVEAKPLVQLHAQLAGAHAVPRFVGIGMGDVTAADGTVLPVEVTMEAMPSVLWDALVLPDGARAVNALMKHGFALDFVRDQYRHCKPMLVLGGAEALLEKLSISRELPDGSLIPVSCSAGPMPRRVRSRRSSQPSPCTVISSARRTRLGCELTLCRGCSSPESSVVARLGVWRLHADELNASERGEHGC
jgi:catalase